MNTKTGFFNLIGIASYGQNRLKNWNLEFVVRSDKQLINLHIKTFRNCKEGEENVGFPSMIICLSHSDDN